MSGLVNKLTDKLSGDSTTQHESNTSGHEGYGSSQNYGQDDGFNQSQTGSGCGNTRGNSGGYGSRNTHGNSGSYGNSNTGAGGIESGYGHQQARRGNSDYLNQNEDTDDWNRASKSNQYGQSQYGDQATNENYKKAQQSQGWGNQGRTTRSQARNNFNGVDDNLGGGTAGGYSGY